MARRTNTAGASDDEVMQYFFGGGRGGQQAIDPMASAMQLMGFGQKAQEAQTSREQQAVENLIRRAQLEQTGAKTQSDIAMAESQMALNEQLKKASIDEALGKVDYQTKQLANDKLKAQLDTAKTMMADTSIPIADRMKMWAALDPDIKNMLDVGAESANKAKARELETNVRGLYKKRAPEEQFKSLLAGYPEEVVALAPWQQMAQEAPGPSGVTQGAGLAGLLWNVPGMLENAYKGVVNATARGLTGPQAAQYQYTKFTDPFAEVPKYREAQAIMEALNAPGQNVGPAPQGPMGGYTTGPVAAPPEWRYGTGTQPTPPSLEELLRLSESGVR
jgi:hypothetical protein